MRAGVIGFALVLWAAIVPASGQAATVLVELDKSVYGPGDVITVTIVNRGASEISLADMQSFCTPVLLERKGRERWEPLYNCPQARAPRTMILQPGGQMAVLVPGPGRPLGATLQGGTYRVSTVYLPWKGRFEGRMPPGALIAHSPDFAFR